MKRQISIFAAFLFLASISTNANAFFFFFFLPGLGGAGDKGDICVAEGAKVGDVSHSPNGNTATIKSVSGTSSRCKSAALPILVNVEFQPSQSFSPKAGVELGNGWTNQTITPLQSFNGMLLRAANKDENSELMIESFRRDIVPDVPKFVENLKARQLAMLDNAKSSPTEEIAVNGLKAWRSKIEGDLKNVFGTHYSYLKTVLLGDEEIVIVTTWTGKPYEWEKDFFESIPTKIVGLKSTAQITSVGSASNQGAVQKFTITAEGVQPATRQSDSKVAPSSNAADKADNVTSRLEKIKNLLSKGLITQAEYDAKKKEIMNSF
ncbi:MAG: SHOCT domain-containing protein [Burkholderiales bacterium]